MKRIYNITLIFVAVIMVVSSCGGSGDVTDSQGTVALYVTDDMGSYEQLTATITMVQLTHTGTGNACDLLEEDASIDIPNLFGYLLMLDSAQCDAVPYNRLHVEFNQDIELTDGNGNSSACQFVSYKDNSNQPNTLHCTGGTCSLNINGSVNVQANKYNTIALDFDLDEFEVEDFGEETCAVTMKVSPLNSSDIDDKKKHKGYKEKFTGYISEVNHTAKTFTITSKWNEVFSVHYGNVIPPDGEQEGLDALLDYAADTDHLLKVRVMSDSINLEEGTITASAVYAKAEGAVLDLSTGNHTFTLKNEAKNIDIPVDYSDAVSRDNVEGDITQPDVWVEVKLSGYDGTRYRAHEVEVTEQDDMETDD